jgi:excisionase family DNA binding protein
VNGALVPLELDWVLRAHLRDALDRHIASQGLDRVPRGILDLRDFVATSGQERERQKDETTVPHPESMLLTLPQCAAVLNIGERSVRRLVEDEELITVSIGRSVRVLRDDLEAYVAGLRAKATMEATG